MFPGITPILWNNFSSLTVIYYSGSGTEVAPSGATHCRVRSYGAGGAGGSAGGVPQGERFGGGAGAFCETTVAISAGDQLSYSVGIAGQPVLTGHGEDGGNTTTSGGTGGFAGITHNAGGGKGGNNTIGTGGTATGGDTNTNGGNAVSNTTVKRGGNSVAAVGGNSAVVSYDPESGQWSTDVFAVAGSQPGAGGGGGYFATSGGGIEAQGAAGGSGAIEFYFYAV